MYKLLTFILLFIYSHVSFSSTVSSYAEKVVDSLYIVELSVNGVVNHWKTEWSDVPDVEYGLKCFESELRPKLKQYFVGVFQSSIEPKELKKGSFLMTKPGVINSKEFILSADFSDEAKLKSVRVDVYTLVMASKEVDNPIEKKELLDASEWLKVNGPLMSNYWISKMDKYQGVIQGALDACFEFE